MDSHHDDPMPDSKEHHRLVRRKGQEYMARGITSQRARKIDALIQLKPRADLVALARIATADLEPVYDHTGTQTETKRRSNVFRILRERDTITPNQSAAGAKATELYATWKGLAGAPDNDECGFIDKGRAQPELVTDRMINAGREWSSLMRFIGPSSARLVLALCQDIVEGDGSFILANDHGQPAVRWRKIVEGVTKETDRNRQAVYVATACADLEEFWK